MNKHIYIVPLLLLSLNCGNGNETKTGNTVVLKNRISSAIPPSRSSKGDSVTIAWDPPAEGAYSVDYYDSFIRQMVTACGR